MSLYKNAVLSGLQKRAGGHAVASVAMAAHRAHAKHKRKKHHRPESDEYVGHKAPADDEVGGKEIQHETEVANAGPGQDKSAGINRMSRLSYFVGKRMAKGIPVSRGLMSDATGAIGKSVERMEKLKITEHPESLMAAASTSPEVVDKVRAASTKAYAIGGGTGLGAMRGYVDPISKLNKKMAPHLEAGGAAAHAMTKDMMKHPEDLEPLVRASEGKSPGGMIRGMGDSMAKAQNRITRRPKIAGQTSIDNEALWDQIDSGGKIACPMLERAPLVEEEGFGAPPPMSPKLAFDAFGLKIKIRACSPEEIGEDMAKIAALSAGSLQAVRDAVREGVRDAGKAAIHPPTLRPGMVGWLQDAGESLVATGRTLFTGKPGISAGMKVQNLALLTGVAGGAVLAARAIRKNQIEHHYDEVLSYVMRDPDLQNEADYSNRVPQAYKFLQRYAPTLAQDSVMSRAFVRQIIKGTGIDALNFRLANELAQAEQSYKQTGSALGDYADIEKMMRHPVARVFTGGGGDGKKK